MWTDKVEQGIMKETEGWDDPSFIPMPRIIPMRKPVIRRWRRKILKPLKDRPFLNPKAFEPTGQIMFRKAA